MVVIFSIISLVLYCDFGGKMRKLVISISALLVSMNVIAATSPFQNLNTTIANATMQKSNNKLSTPSMIYGGQDISRSRMATANESMWIEQQSLVG
jgi:hypothetical protein